MLTQKQKDLLMLIHDEDTVRGMEVIQNGAHVLADRLGVSLSEILVLDSDTAQLLDEPLLCPDVEPEDTAFAFVYVQHQQVIYPYQFYASAAANGVVVEACEDTLVDEDVLTMPTPNVRSELVALIEADLRQRGVDAETGRFAVQPMVWHDEALGCPVTVDAPTPAPELVEGFLVTYTLDDRTYEYHTDGTGERITYCEPPMGHAANAAFIYSLRLDDMREVEVPEETVTYDGLDATGEVVLLTENQFRIGLFDFDTPDEARQAARLIDDERVAHIYVSGYVLIVQEENSPQVSSILLQFRDGPGDDLQGGLAGPTRGIDTGLGTLLKHTRFEFSKVNRRLNQGTVEVK